MIRTRRHDRSSPGRSRAAVALPAAAFTVAVLVPLACFLVTSWLLGWKLQPVLSASMEPTYPVGSLLVVEPLDASAVRPGMVITYTDPAEPGRLVTHRVLRPVPGEALAFHTQGDANITPDPLPVPARMVRGKVVRHVSHVGAAVRWLEWPRGFLLLVVGPALGLVLTEVVAWRRRRSRRGLPPTCPVCAEAGAT